MSRHKLVKNLDLDEELDDFDGYQDDENSEGTGLSPHEAASQIINIAPELSANDRSAALHALHRSNILRDLGQLQEGTTQVRHALGSHFPVSDRDIEDSLWHYYYDVEKTVNYLISMCWLPTRCLSRPKCTDG